MTDPALNRPVLSGHSTSPPRDTRTKAGWVYLSVILSMAYVVNFVDRQIVNILAEPIKRDLALSDWQLGVLTGLSFAVVYAAMAIPVARIADRHNRPRLIAAALTIWSGATAACGLSQNFAQLAAARLVVGVGEAGYTPAAYSLLTESVPPHRRTLAFGILGAGLPLGSLIAMVFGGIVADAWGWRAAFWLAGLPGIAMAALMLTVADPRKSSLPIGKSPQSGSYRGDVRLLLRKRSFRVFCVAGGLVGMSSYGCYAFVASFFFRSHGSELGDLAKRVNAATGTHIGQNAVLGTILGLIVGATGLGSALLSGWLTDRLVARDVRHYGTMCGAPFLLAVPALAFALYAPTLNESLALIAVHFTFAGLAVAPWAASIQALAPNHLRATASALSLVALILIGNGLGPLLVGVASDLLVASGWPAPSALQAALLIGGIPSLLAATLYAFSIRDFQRELADA